MHRIVHAMGDASEQASDVSENQPLELLLVCACPAPQPGTTAVIAWFCRYESQSIYGLLKPTWRRTSSAPFRSGRALLLLTGKPQGQLGKWSAVQMMRD